MADQSKSWERNTEGLRKNAQEKANATRCRVEEAVRLLLKEQRVINFKTIAETARVSTAWLYGHEDIKMRIIHLRSQQTPNVQVKLPLREQASNASKDTLIGVLQERVKKQADELRELKKQLEVTSAQLQKLLLQ
jgi:hypothetical protein